MLLATMRKPVRIRAVIEVMFHNAAVEVVTCVQASTHASAAV